ncbi:HAMP domain-containing histidine kinase [Candidatus Gracilibacteria bacterium]|nr:HAMP domain-containing histidine kinase [Candidatus Gracilibacteria bacterium]
MEKVNLEYISIIGHEMRTPLTSIRGYLSMILEGDMGDISPEARKALNHCYDSSVRLIKLVNDVLVLSKIENGKMEYYPSKIEITEFLKSVYNDIFIEAEEKKIDVKIEIDKNLKQKNIFYDENRLKQVFINLISNALKFTDLGGEVIIKASLKGNNVIFEIIDNGVGIAKEELEKIFEKFSQASCDLQRLNSCGLGIGLALVKNILKDFKSQINVKSEVGKGSNFYFELNLA